MSKELFMDAHEQVIEEYLEAHPNSDWYEAYNATADVAYVRMTENVADLIDRERDRRKEER